MVSSQSINQTHTQPKAINKRPLLILGVLLCVIYFLIIIALQDQIKKTVIQNKLDDLNHHLLYQKALRTYLITQLKPVFLELQKAKKISFDFFEPRAQSSTYIARHVFTIYQQNLKKNGLHGWNFKIAARNPMNPTNQATSQELSLLNQFNEDRTLNKVERVETLAGRKTLYVAIPLKANTAECLRCHGFPSSAPKSLTKRYGTTHGFYEKIGEIRGFISYRIDLKEITQNAQIAL